MPPLKKEGLVLRPDQRAYPVLWVSKPRNVLRGPPVSDAVMERIFDMSKNTKQLRSWGHDPTGAHWLATKGGTALHTDPAYTRYTHHLVLRNDGFYLHGVNEGRHLPTLAVGSMLCLDTWSPHKLVRDPRLAKPGVQPVFKLAIAVDRDKPILNPDDVWALLAPRLLDASVLPGIEKWAKRSPSTKDGRPIE